MTNRAAMSQSIVGRKCRGERGDAEDEKVDLISEAPAEGVAEKAGCERADRHADEGQRDELRILPERREVRRHGRAEHVGADVEIVPIEEHPGADEPKDALVKARDRQAIK